LIREPRATAKSLWLPELFPRYGRVSVLASYRHPLARLRFLAKSDAARHGQGVVITDLRSSHSSRLRVLIVDDHELVRRGLCGLLQSQADMQIVCEGSNGREAVLLAKEYRPDLVLLDIVMPVMNGFEAARLIKQELPDTRILMVSQCDSQAHVKEAFAAGANGFVIKDKAATDLIPAVRRISWPPTATLPMMPDEI
jgi:CheY-like chemotaxis protein